MRLLENSHLLIFADGADKASILELNKQSYIKGFTTNPTLMRKAGIVYVNFSRCRTSRYYLK